MLLVQMEGLCCLLVRWYGLLSWIGPIIGLLFSIVDCRAVFFCRPLVEPPCRFRFVWRQGGRLLLVQWQGCCILLAHWYGPQFSVDLRKALWFPTVGGSGEVDQLHLPCCFLVGRPVWLVHPIGPEVRLNFVWLQRGLILVLALSSNEP